MGRDFPFERLDVYEAALDYAESIYRLVGKFPEVEKFALASQARRAASSVPLNIAEGRGRGTDKDFVRFLFTARGSLFETVTVLKLAVRLGYLTSSETQAVKEAAYDLSARLMALIKSLTPRQLDSSTSRPSN